MIISEDIMKEALRILIEDTQASMNLPIQIDGAKEFFLAKGDDSRILAFTAFLHEGSEYKIGVRKS